MSITPVSNVTFGGTGGSGSGTSSAIDTTGANLLVIAIGCIGGATPSVPTDSKGNTWVALTASTLGNTRQQIYYAKNATVGSGHTFSVTGAGFVSFVASAWAGADTVDPFDQQSGANTAAGTSLSPGSVTPTTNGQLVIVGTCMVNATAGFAVNGGFSILGTVTSSGGNHLAESCAYLVQTTAAAANPSYSWTGTDEASSRIATFRASDGLNPGIVTAVADANGINVYWDGTNGSTAPSGGTLPRTAQLYRSTTFGFTPGPSNIVAGATGTSYTDTTTTESIAYFYKLVVTDAVPTSVTSTQVGGVRPRAVFKTWFLGDSIYESTPSGGAPPPTTFGGLVLCQGGHVYGASVSNQAHSGYSTATWLSGTILEDALDTIEALYGAAHPTTNPVWCIFRLGANDANAVMSAATFGANLATIKTAVLARGMNMILNYPYGFKPGLTYAAQNALTQAYFPHIDAACDEERVFLGDTKLWDLSQSSYTGLNAVDVHPDAAAARLLAQTDAGTLARVAFPDTEAARIIGG